METEVKDRTLQIAYYSLGIKLGALQCRTGRVLKTDYLLPRNVWPPHCHKECFYWLWTPSSGSEEGKEMQQGSAESSVNGARVRGQAGGLLQDWGL